MYSVVDKLSFSEWLEYEMRVRGLSQADLARQANVTRGAINNVVTGMRFPGKDLCIAIAHAFNIPPEEVLRKAGLLPPKPEIDPETEEAEYLLARMKPEQRRQALAFIRFLATTQEGKSTNVKTLPSMESPEPETP